MNFIGKQILAAHNSAENNILVGWAGNDLSIAYSGGAPFAEATILDKAMTPEEVRLAILNDRGSHRVSDFDGFWGQVRHAWNSSIDGIRYDDNGYPSLCNHMEE